jgi:hypothetical protein
MNDPPTALVEFSALPWVVSFPTFQHSARLMAAPGFSTSILTTGVSKSDTPGPI